MTDAPEETIIGRLRERNGLSEDEAKKRINSQMDRMERIGRSDFVINNSGDMAELGTTIKELWDRRVVN